MNPTGAPLLPKLRGYFAEFLRGRSLTRLGILSPSTSVGLRYGQSTDSLEVFLGSVESAHWFGRSRSLLAYLSVLVAGFAYRPTSSATAHFQPDGSLIL